jgi:hypothetical protein
LAVFHFFVGIKPTSFPYPVANYVLLKHRSGDKRLETIING